MVQVIGYAGSLPGSAGPVVTSGQPDYEVYSARFAGASDLEFINFKFLDRVDVRCAAICSAGLSHDIEFEDDELTNTLAPTTAQPASPCLQIENASYDITVRDSNIHGCLTGVLGPAQNASVALSDQQISHDITIAHNVISQNLDNGIQLAEWRNVTIDHNTIENNSDPSGTIHEDGIQFVGSDQNVSITGNVIHDTGQLIFLQDAVGPIDNVLIQDNVLYDCKTYAVQNEGATHTSFIHDTIWNVYAALLLRAGYSTTATDTTVADSIIYSIDAIDGANVGYEDYNLFAKRWVGSGAHDIVSSTPGFVNPFSPDFHLASYSPAIGAGSNEYAGLLGLQAPAADADGASWRSPPSMGAYEYAG